MFLVRFLSILAATVFFLGSLCSAVEASPPSVSVGFSHALGLKGDGTVVAWGDNTQGQTTIPGGLAGVIAVAAGQDHSLALKSDGTVVAWGSNGDGKATVPGGMTGVTAVAAGWSHSLALKSDGTVVAWGSDADGQSAVPGGLVNVVAIAAGGMHSLALKSDGTVVAWGDDTQGQSAVPGGLTGVIAVAAGWWHSLALKSDGTVVAWGSNVEGQSAVPGGLTGAIAVAAGLRHSLALKSDGTVVAWGYNSNGQATVPGGLAGVSAITAGGHHSLALKSDGTVTAWGSSLGVAPSFATGLVSSIAAGTYHSGVLKNNADVVLWGRNGSGQSTVPPALTDVVQIGLGFETSFAVKSDGTVEVWGTSTEGQSDIPLGLDNVKQIAVGSYHTLALKSDGTVVGWGANNIANYGQATIPGGLGDVVAVAAGTFHSLALKSDGTVVAWGNPPVNLGGVNYDMGQTAIPGGLNNVVAIAAGFYHSLALKADGTVVGWGSNIAHPAQPGNITNQATPPGGLLNVKAIKAGGYHSIALQSDGAPVLWGRNDDAQATVPGGLAAVRALVGGGHHTLAVTGGGAVEAWGRNDDSQTDIPGLTVTVAPQGAIDAGGQWSIDAGTTWYNSGVTLIESPADYTVSFRPITGWMTPGDQIVTVSDAIASGSGTYVINQYTLTYTAGANGSITGSSPQTVNHGGSGTAVTAVPVANYHFVQWSDGSTANPRTDANVTGNITVTASFAIDTFQLSVAKDGTGGGVVNSNVGGINCGSICSALYNANTVVTLTATQDATSTFSGWSGGVCTGTGTCDVTMDAAKSVTAVFALVTHTVTPSAGANGSMTPSTPQTVTHLATTAFTVTPDAGYHIVSVSGCGGSLAGNTFTTGAITGNCTVTATFAINTYTLTYTAGANGSITGTSPQTVNHGANGTAVTAVPNTGYHFVQWSDASTANPRTDTNVTGTISVTATFAIDTFTVTPSAGANGSMTPSTPQTVNYNATTAFTVTPNAGYHIVSVSGCGGSLAGNTFTTGAITGNCTVTATFEIDTFTVTPSAGANGSMTPSTPQTVNYNATTAFTVTPNAGYHIVSVSGCGGSLAGNTFTTGAITGNCTVTATFAINTYTLTYTAGANGSITGTSPQTVNHGASGTAVTAVPDTGYVFVQWSDGSTANPRTDTNVTGSISVSASFAACVASSLSHASATVVPAGTTGSVGVTADGVQCSWAAASSDGWIAVTGGTPGTGNGTVQYSVSANATALPRTGTITIGGLSFTVTQGTTALQSTIGVFLNGGWYLDANANGIWDGEGTDVNYMNFGSAPGAKPVMGDWDGTDIVRIGVFWNGQWFLDMNGNGTWDGSVTDRHIANFGSAPGAIPVTGDWDGSGTTRIGVFWNGQWFLDMNGNGTWDGSVTDRHIANFGSAPGAIPVTGDWDGSGTTRIGVFWNGSWYLDLNGNGSWDGDGTDLFVASFGSAPGATPVVGDWVGIGVTHIGVFLNGAWYLDLNGDGVWQGGATDQVHPNFGSAPGAIPGVGR